ncbi:MAG: hypothetical protein J4A00_08605 [Gammaproteobacteria bacterium]|nr:hypothetical protein [Gammaproteobacteria bacterium]
MVRVDNVADQVPPSAWLSGLSLQDRGARATVATCAGSGCHQFPDQRVQRFTLALNQSAPSEQVTPHLEQGWRSMVSYMRLMALRFAPDLGLRWGITPEDPNFARYISAENSLFNQRDEDLVATTLSHYLAGMNFEEYSADEFAVLRAPLGVTEKTVIREYDLRTDGWTREVAISPLSPYAWVVEDSKDRVGRLNLTSGHVTWSDLPEGQQGPHTINAGPDGELWISLEESFGMARLDPVTEQWRFYPDFGEFSLVHDACFNEKRVVQKDSSGRIWMTLLGTNQLASLEPESGALETVDMPVPEGESIFHAALYGCVINSDSSKLWFTHLNSTIGSFDITTGEVDAWFDMPEGSMPHRMAIDERDVVYVALSGEGQVWALDSRDPSAKPVLYDLPDRNSAPYSVTWDTHRQALWVATGNNNIIYQLNPATGKFLEFPLPRNDAFLRMIEVDQETGDLWTAYARLPVGDGPNYAVWMVPGDL